MKFCTIPIGGQKWQVDLVRAKHPIFEGACCHGMTVRDKCRIYLARGFATPIIEDTFVHEVFGHAAFYVSGVYQTLVELCGGDEDKANETEEAMIRALVAVWYPLLQQFKFEFPKAV